MDNNLFQKIKDFIAKSNNIGIAVGSNPSLDQMAAALSLYLSLNKVNKKAIVVSPTQPIVEIASLVGINKVQTSFGSEAGDLVVTFPYNEGEIDKVSYTLENNHLNIIVKAGEKGLTFNENDVRFVRGGGSIDLLFVIGTPKLSDLGNLLSADQLKNVKIINIDNKQENQGFGDVVHVLPRASSVSEVVTEVLVELGFNIDQDASQNLLSGMVSATDNFISPNSSALAFEMAGILMQRGATRFRNDSASTFMPKAQSQQQFQPQQVQQSFQQQVQQPFQVEQPIKQETFNPNPVQNAQQIEQVEKELQAAQNNQEGVNNDKAPLDWLTPKVYKGGSGVSTA